MTLARTLTTIVSMLLLVAMAQRLAAQTVRTVASAEALRELLAQPHDSMEIKLMPGSYHLIPTSHVESTCGNCVDSATSVRYTRGLRVSGRGVRIVGPPDRSAVIVTHSGYGILVEDCIDCSIENLTITGGERDTSAAATDAAIVVRRSSVTIRSNRITGNIGDSARVARTVVGIMAICGREGSDMLIEGNELMRNSWDAIALYRSAHAVIRGNVIDGVDAAAGGRIAGGRGVAIGITWNAVATVEENLIRRYWKGIGVFLDASAIIRRNVVEDILTWGISYWDGGKGAPRADMTDNVVFMTGACGISIARTTPGDNPGRLERNVIVRTAQNPTYDSADYYCAQCALALHAVPVGFRINDNLFFDNRRADSSLPQFNVSDEVFLPAIRQWCKPLSVLPALSRSDFIRRFCSSDGEIGSGRP